VGPPPPTGRSKVVCENGRTKRTGISMAPHRAGPSLPNAALTSLAFRTMRRADGPRPSDRPIPFAFSGHLPSQSWETGGHRRTARMSPS
jgi:hypothetical protein